MDDPVTPLGRLAMWKILEGNCLDTLRQLPSGSVQTCVTSPPYFKLRDYQDGYEYEWPDGWRGQLGQEGSVKHFIEHLVIVFREVRRILRDDGTLWLNLGDNFGPDKQMNAVPWKAAFALQRDGWLLRQDIIWDKPNAMPEPVTDRCTAAHEYVFLLAKQRRYYYDQEPIRGNWADKRQGRSGNASKTVEGQLSRAEGGNRGTTSRPSEAPQVTGPNARTVWSISTKPFSGAHFAVFPPELPERCVLAGTSAHGQCADCGAPWRRQIEKVVGDPQSSKPDAAYQEVTGKHSNSRAPTTFFKQAVSTVRKTVGWEPSCDCNCDRVVPQTVLDPFNGSGTTGEVSLNHGRFYIGCEQNPEYIKIAKARLIGADKADFQGALIFCPGCEKAGRPHLIARRAIERARETGRRVSCPQCYQRFFVEELE